MTLRSRNTYCKSMMQSKLWQKDIRDNLSLIHRRSIYFPNECVHEELLEPSMSEALMEIGKA